MLFFKCTNLSLTEKTRNANDYKKLSKQSRSTNSVTCSLSYNPIFRSNLPHSLEYKIYYHADCWWVISEFLLIVSISIGFKVIYSEANSLVSFRRLTVTKNKVPEIEFGLYREYGLGTWPALTTFFAGARHIIPPAHNFFLSPH